MADELLARVDDMLADRRATAEQFRYAVARIAESLREVHRVARSRGERLRTGREGQAPSPGRRVLTEATDAAPLRVTLPPSQSTFSDCFSSGGVMRMASGTTVATPVIAGLV